ncbi:MAG: hypothetical protein IKP28_00290 [Clostridia bacterium]|nr:hypothetical protein [Clostridia bacterium]
MENASKALIMAAGVFLAMLVIGAFLYMWNAIGGYAQEVENKKLTEQVSAFNMQYESYLGRVLRGNDVATVVNKVRNNNQKDTPNQVIWEFTISPAANMLVFTPGTYVSTDTNSNNYFDSIISNATLYDEFIQLYFVCTGVEYDSTTGYANKISFLQRYLKQ